MADRITAIRPGPALCPLGGVAYPVHEARLCDLLALQSWVDARWKAPDLDGGLRAAGDDPLARDRVLFSAYAAFADGPPVFSSPEGCAAMFGTEAGLTEFLLVALTRGTPDADLPSLVAAVSEGTPEALGWFAAVQAAFYGADPLTLIRGLLGLAGDRPHGDPVTWGEAVVDVCREFGWTLETVLSLSLTEFVAVRRGGKPKDAGFRPPPGQLEAFRDRQCLALYGATAAEHFGA